MNTTVAWILVAVIGYLLGSVSTGILYSRSMGRDIRTQGSKNSGATNMTRVHGIKSGALTFLGDCAKGVIAALIGKWLGGQTGAIIGGTAAVIGHTWPVFFGFKGGKGVATCMGVGMFTFPPFGVGAIAIGAAVMLISRYVSLGSMVGMAVFGVAMTIRYGFWPLGLWACALAGLVIWRHRGNIQRLLSHTEHKMGEHTDK